MAVEKVLSKEGQLVLASAVILCLVGEIVEHEEGQLLFTCRIVNVTSVQSRLSGLCTLLIEVAANIDSIWNMWMLELKILLTKSLCTNRV